jgi:hypothetical protein
MLFYPHNEIECFLNSAENNFEKKDKIMNKPYTKNRRASRYVTGATPTAERHRHQGGFHREFIKADGSSGKLVKRYRARWASPLDLYHDRQIIDRPQHQAGLRFGRAYHHVVSSEVACRERSRRIDNPETPDISDGLQLALKFVEQTYAALTSDTVNVMIDVCAYAKPAASPEALDKLRRGLGRLALEWGMAATEFCHRSKN